MQTARQWMVTHNWMVEGNRQSEWIDKRGIMLWLAFYFGGLGGGAYIVSLFFNNLLGMALGVVIAVGIKGILHLFFLGKPARFWRLLFHPQTSWLSRGLFFVFTFGGFAFVQLVLSYLTKYNSSMPDVGALIMVLKILAGICALCVATYTGFVLNSVKGVPYWGLSLLPVLFLACGVLGGFGLNVAIAAYDHSLNLDAAEMGSRIMLIVNVVIIALYLGIEARRHDAGKKSVLMQIRGSISGQFWFGVVALGIVVPAVIAISSIFTGEATAWVLVTGTVCEIIGGAMLRYCVLKSGMYNPMFMNDSIIKRGKSNVRA
jgi:formate-dependent nitrite reductase membrane component NrfD